MTHIKILIVDDERDFSDKLSEYLRLLGYETHIAYSGEQALNIIRKVKPEVLLCDLKMQGAIHGDDILSQLKAINPKTVPIIITAYKDEAVQKRLAEKGAAKCLTKPLQIDELINILENIESKFV
jgi:DNA-binding NtrC family response regulator